MTPRADLKVPAVIVTGASSGIGRAAALTLEARGWRVFAGVRHEADAAAVGQDASGPLVPLILDVTDPSSIATAAEAVRAALGTAGLSGLVNCAGGAAPAPLEYLTLDAFRQRLEVNLVGQLATIQAFLPLIRLARGRIVNVSSVAGRLPMPFNGAYCAAKHGLEGLTDVLRMELAPEGIRVCLIQPGTTATAMGRKFARAAEASLAALPAEGRERYGTAFRAFAEAIAGHARRGSPPAVVVHAILDALTAPVPRTRYPVGAAARPALLLARVLPDRAIDSLIGRFFNLPGSSGVCNRSVPNARSFEHRRT